MNYDSPRELSRILQEHGIGLKKRWGQNFLIDRNVRAAIANLVTAPSGSIVWEVGPGLGAMTAELLARGFAVTAFELDRGFIRILEEEFGGRLEIVAGDVTRTWRAHAERAGTPAAVLGNLPYSAASAILAAFLEAHVVPPQTVVMVQREVAERMDAAPGSKDYSSFSVLVQSHAVVQKQLNVAPSAFYPKPEVSSTVVELTPRDVPLSVTDWKLFHELTRTLFMSRRKTIWNNLRGSVIESRIGKENLLSAVDGLSFPVSVRGETLSPEDVAELANRLAPFDASRQ